MKKKIAGYYFKDGVIHILSSSGGKYIISHNYCSCKGFGFRKNCSHYTEAEEEGLLKQLDQHLQKKKKLGVHSRAIHVIKSRKDALRKFLTKNNIPFTKSLIDKIEPKITIETRLSDLIKLINNL